MSSSSQRHVVPADLAARMFVECAGGTCPHRACRPSVRWLVGPINCETCDGDAVVARECPACHGSIAPHACDGWPAGSIVERCPDCDGKGYPPTVEIVSETPRFDGSGRTS